MILKSILAFLLAFFAPATAASVNEAAFAAFSSFLEKSVCVPPNTSIIGAYIEGDVLTLDATADILNYGGTEREIELVEALKALTRPFADKLTLLIDGKARSLPEGTEIFELDVGVAPN